MAELDKQYTNAALPGSFSGKSAFLRALKSRGTKVSRQDVDKYLMNEETYTLHRPNRKKYKRNQVIVSGIDDTFQADLIDVSNISRFNDDNKFILTCIDVFSKYTWVVPIKRKGAQDVLAAFKTIFQDGRVPKRLQTDEGNEFMNRALRAYLEKLGIKIYILNSEMKAAVVKRLNRTLKEKMWRYFTHTQNYRYIEVLPDLVYSYNNTYHRTIKTSPSQVTKKNEDKIWEIMYGHRKDMPLENSIEFKFKVGDLVRISKVKMIFDKGYTANWTREIFKIYERLPRRPPVYRIADTHPTKPEVIDGVFYEENLQKITKTDDIYYVEKILKERVIRGKKEAYIKWLGYPDKYNSWEPVSNFIKSFGEPLEIDDEQEDINKERDRKRLEKKERIQISI